MATDSYSVCIIGLGLMGGSLALALRDARADAPSSAEKPNGAGSEPVWHVIGVDRDPEVLAAAQAAGAIQSGTTDLALGVAQADAVVLATPVRTILRLLPEVGKHAQPGTLILDLGSSKTDVCAAMAELPAGLQPVGGHPMCGSEQAGFAAARPGLYRGRTFVLCSLPRTEPSALTQAGRLARATGALIVQADPVEHDATVAAISHLPYLVAAALVRAVETGGDPLAWKLAASGFRDTTRVAAGSVEVMLDTVLTNRGAVLDWLDIFGERLATLRTALATGDEETLNAEIAAAHNCRAKLT